LSMEKIVELHHRKSKHILRALYPELRP
jgi:hypothetical protein